MVSKNDEKFLRAMCDIFGFSPYSLKTKIDVYSRDSSGKKVIIDKRLYSVEDLIEQTENIQKIKEER